jgi:hypothetical protein
MALVLPYTAIVGAPGATYPRWYLPLLPPFAVLAAMGLLGRPARCSGWRVAVATAVVAYSVTMGASRVEQLALNDRPAVVAWVRERARRGPVSVGLDRLLRDYDGLAALFDGEPSVRVEWFRFLKEDFGRKGPDVVVLSSRATSMLRAMEDGDPTYPYRLAAVVPAGYFTDYLYTVIDPGLRSTGVGATGFHIYERRHEDPR